MNGRPTGHGGTWAGVQVMRGLECQFASNRDPSEVSGMGLSP